MNPAPLNLNREHWELIPTSTDDLPPHNEMIQTIVEALDITKQLEDVFNDLTSA